jgi:hypothetical protein
MPGTVLRAAISSLSPVPTLSAIPPVSAVSTDARPGRRGALRPPALPGPALHDPCALPKAEPLCVKQQQQGRHLHTKQQ